VGVAYIQSTATTSYVLRFVLLNPDGTPVSDTLIEGASAVGRMQPDLVWSGTEYGLVWVESLGSRFLRLDANGAAKGTPTGSIGPGGSTKTTLAWSSVYGGYAIGATQGSAGYFRLLGADGSTPAAATTFTRSSGGVGGSIQIAPAPAGGFGLAFGPSRPGLAAFDVNGTLTTPAVSVSTQTMSQMSNIGLVHDGTTWLTTWVDGLENGIRVNRGDQNNGSHIIVSVPSPFRVVSPTVQIANGTLAMAWGKYDGSTSTNSPYTLQMQRFALPSTLTSAPTPLHAVVDMPVTPSSAFNEVGLVYTGSTSMLVVWSDNRWGNSEIYAAPLELGTCP
jgi:hypothetical protein